MSAQILVNKRKSEDPAGVLFDRAREQLAKQLPTAKRPPNTMIWMEAVNGTLQTEIFCEGKVLGTWRKKVNWQNLLKREKQLLQWSVRRMKKVPWRLGL